MPVEARSLGDITSLAFNPPAYPAPTTLSRINALVLYIVRVPGSGDVFLTPLKPRDRVVNAQDVESSLYYLHLDVLADHAIRDRASPREEQAEFKPQDTLAPLSANRVHRKPLPTPPTSPRAGLQADAPSSPRPSVSSIQRKPLLPARPSNRSSVSSYDSVSGQAPSRTSSEDIGQKFVLIRRNPSSGEQWNVARIHDPPVDEISSASTTSQENHGSSTRRKNSGAPLYLEIDNPGYASFSAQYESCFKRRMWMDGSRYADHMYSNQASAKLGRSHKGYAFFDLWDRRCSFSTGNTGKSLKCRREASETDSAMVTRTEISELRFNLPVLHLASRSGPSNGHAKSSSVGAVKSQHSSDSDASQAPVSSPGHALSGSLDYSLGRERAGGGFGGREAKLGKLIVYEAGQEMLDLVVAANMALWWRAYERTAL